MPSVFGKLEDLIVANINITRRVVPSEVGPPSFVREETDAEFKARIRSHFGHADPPPDPWVVVGTTTIDGTIGQVVSALAERQSIDRTIYCDDEVIDIMVRTSVDLPWLVGGRHLRARGSHINLATNTALIRCDIVRRQSEIDAEARVRPCVNCEDAPVGAGGTFCEACTADLRASEAKPTCPECGPHGNRGRVALAFSEVACTTCAGGVPGDAFGSVEQVVDVEVKPDETWPKPGLLGSNIAELINQQNAALFAATAIPARYFSPGITEGHTAIAEHHAAYWRALYEGS